jgi:hypothetical protein
LDNICDKIYFSFSKAEPLSPAQTKEPHACRKMSLKTAGKDINPVYLAVDIFEFEGAYDGTKRVELVDLSDR